MIDNPLKRKLLSGSSAFGIFAIEFFTPGFMQVVKAAGADFALLDMEHSGASIDVMKEQLSYSRGLGIAPFVRVPAAQYHFIARILDMGALGIMVPMVESAEQARYIVQCAKYPPAGRRGAAFGIAQDDYQGGPVPDKVKQANERVFLMLQIETREGVAQVDAIAAVDGVDSLWIGALDLSNFHDCHGDFQHPDYLRAVDKVVAAGRKHGKPLGTNAATEAFARDYYAKGFRVFTFGPDTLLLQQSLSSKVEALRSLAQDE